MRSVNQNHHLYVASDVLAKKDHVTESSPTGTIELVESGNLDLVDSEIYFLYKGRDGVTRSDMIPVKQINYVKYIPAANQVSKLRTATITLDSAALNPDTNLPYVGKDYVLNISFQNFYGLSPEDTYVKTVAVHMTKKITSIADFWTAMIDELNASFSREVGADAQNNPYLTFTPGTITLNEGEDNEETINTLVITEKEQPWSLGKWESESLFFEVFPSTVYVDGDDVTWGEVSYDVSSTTIPNSKKMADLEWFTFKERADIYGGMGYPNNFDFVPMVKSDSTAGYDALEIHFAYLGSCEDIQKSEKDITIIMEHNNAQMIGAPLLTLEGRIIDIINGE